MMLIEDLGSWTQHFCNGRKEENTGSMLLYDDMNYILQSSLSQKVLKGAKLSL